MQEQFFPKIMVAGLTDTGMKRDHNEDAFLIDKKLKLAFVADGMGGHEAGEVASQMAVETIADFIYECDPDCLVDNVADIVAKIGSKDEQLIKSVRVVKAAVENANRKICEENQVRGFIDGQGMGTTVAGIQLIEEGKKLVVFHVGDSRVYRLRNKKLEQITVDHSLYQEWLKRGGEGEAPRTNIILRALGPYGEVEADVAVHETLENDIILMCSDGLNDMVSDEDIEKISGIYHSWRNIDGKYEDIKGFQGDLVAENIEASPIERLCVYHKNMIDL